MSEKEHDLTWAGPDEVMRRATTPETTGQSTDPLSSAVQFMRSLFTWRKPKPAGKQYQVTDHRGHSWIKYLTDEEAEKSRAAGYTLILAKDLPGQPQLVDDHEARVLKSLGQGTVTHKLTHKKFGKKWSGKIKTGRASFETTIVARRKNAHGGHTDIRIPASDFTSDDEIRRDYVKGGNRG
jgi:hypothetical protein